MLVGEVGEAIAENGVVTVGAVLADELDTDDVDETDDADDDLDEDDEESDSDDDTELA